MPSYLPPCQGQNPYAHHLEVQDLFDLAILPGFMKILPMRREIVLLIRLSNNITNEKRGTFCAFVSFVMNDPLPDGIWQF